MPHIPGDPTAGHRAVTSCPPGFTITGRDRNGNVVCERNNGVQTRTQAARDRARNRQRVSRRGVQRGTQRRSNQGNRNNPVIGTFFRGDGNQNETSRQFDRPYYLPLNYSGNAGTAGGLVRRGTPLHAHRNLSTGAITIMTEHSMGDNDNSVVVTTQPPRSGVPRPGGAPNGRITNPPVGARRNTRVPRTTTRRTTARTQNQNVQRTNMGMGGRSGGRSGGGSGY